MNQEPEEPIVWISEEELSKQRRIAKDLKKTPWWKKKKGAGVCHYCGNKFSPEELTMDHLIPLAKGGKSIKANLVPACRECNFAKKNKLPFEFDGAADPASKPSSDFNSASDSDSQTRNV